MVSDDQRKMFGKTCRWLTFGYDCHMSTCILNLMRREALYDRFLELGLKHREFAYHVFSDSCYKMNTGFSCFDSTEPPEECDLIEVDGVEFTPLELEAKKIAEEELKDDNHVKALYEQGRNHWLKLQEKKIAEAQAELDEVMKEKVA